MSGYQLPAGKVLVLRTSDRDGRSMNGFQWPATGRVQAEQGGRLWGLLWGHGAGYHLLYRGTRGSVYQVVEVDASDVQFDHGKASYPSGVVLMTTPDQRAAVDFLNLRIPPDIPRVPVRPEVKAGVAMQRRFDLERGLLLILAAVLLVLTLTGVLWWVVGGLIGAVPYTIRCWVNVVAIWRNQHAAGDATPECRWLPTEPRGDFADIVAGFAAGDATLDKAVQS